MSIIPLDVRDRPGAVAASQHSSLEQSRSAALSHAVDRPSTLRWGRRRPGREYSVQSGCRTVHDPIGIIEC
jgi:hypothetical protein